MHAFSLPLVMAILMDCPFVVLSFLNPCGLFVDCVGSLFCHPADVYLSFVFCCCHVVMIMIMIMMIMIMMIMIMMMIIII